MKIQLFCFILLIAISSVGNDDNQYYGVVRDDNVVFHFYRHKDKPSDPNKTPLTPSIIESYQSIMQGRARVFYFARIFFDKDELGNPIYKTIGQHAKDNPKFSQVKLVLFHKAAWYKLRFKDEFEILGTYADESARRKLIDSITPSYLWERETDRGGVWCPAHNAIIGGTRNLNICERVGKYLHGEL